MTKFLAYDLFSGSPKQDPLWLEAADDLTVASEHMKQRAHQTPGKYFIYSCKAGTVLATLDTSAKGPRRASKTRQVLAKNGAKNLG
jgi:hypothetical protein